MLCPACGSQIADNDLTCGDCGDALNGKTGAGDVSTNTASIPVQDSDDSLGNHKFVGDTSLTVEAGGTESSAPSSMSKVIGAAVVLALLAISAYVIRSRRARRRSKTMRPRDRAIDFLSANGVIPSDLPTSVQNTLSSLGLSKKQAKRVLVPVVAQLRQMSRARGRRNCK